MAKQRKNQTAEEQVVEQTQAGAEQPQATETTGTTEANGHGPSLSRRTDERVFSSEAEARTAGPQPGCEKWRLWSVSGPGGGSVYLWANNHGMALVGGARHLGVKAVCVDRPVNREAIASGLAQMSEEERAALLAQYMPR
jgi:hypothetical protein